MTSTALVGLLSGVKEVQLLREFYPVKAGHLASGNISVAAKAHGRACVVLLSSHFERYLYAINEEAVDWINRERVRTTSLPRDIRLLHSRESIEDLARTDWLKREQKLVDFFASESDLWAPSGVTGSLDHNAFLKWMKAPKPKDVRRYYAQWGIDDIFKGVTRNGSTRSELWLQIASLVDKRNNIAHGDMQTEALPTEITTYARLIKKFCTSADSYFARELKKLCSATSPPW